MCPTISKMGVRLWHVCSWCARWRILRCGGFTAISQLRNECTGLPNGTHVPKSGFAAAKYPTKWSFGSEIGSFYALWFRSRFAAAKWGSLCCEMALVCQKSASQRGAWGCEMVSQQSADFAEACFSPIFPLFLHFSCSKWLSFNFFAIPPDFDHPKTYITSKQSRIKALKSKLKQVTNKTKRYGLASL